MNESITLKYPPLFRFCMDVFQHYGFTYNNSKIISDVLLLADLYGIQSHGVQRMFRYHKGLKDGSMHPDTKAGTVFETGISAVIDGNMAMGQVTSYHAMNLAIQKAKENGVGLVTVRNSNHYGIAGFYAKMAADQGLIGISCTNTAAVSVPTFGSYAMLGSNPIAVAVPAHPHLFLFDASTTVVARGKVEVYNKAGKQLPPNWAVDGRGQITQDAAQALSCTLSREGGLLPLGGAGEETGGYKGYGYGILCELMSSILSLGVTCNHVTISGGGVSHGFAAIDLKLFGEPERIIAHFSTFLQELRNTPKAQGADRVYVHGEKEQINYERRMKEGIPIQPKTFLEMREMAEDVGLDIRHYFDVAS